jgi:hypothetical protein
MPGGGGRNAGINPFIEGKLCGLFIDIKGTDWAGFIYMLTNGKGDPILGLLCHG